MLSRRFLLAGSMAAAMLAVPRLSFAKVAGERRFVFVIQRGAADGLHLIAPLGDPGLAAARPALAEDLSAAHRLDSFFALHQALAQTAGLFKSGEALFAHAVATANRDRSHFDAQNILETGGTRAYEQRSGWMNRLLSLMPGTRGLAVAQAIPMAMRGDAPVSSYAPSRLPDASAALMMRVAALYEGDAQLHPVWEQATQTRALVDDLAQNGGRGGQAAGELAARLLAPADGARVLMLETGGWDTHSAQKGRLAAQLGGLDRLILALRTGLGPAWRDTLVIVATEFGRTVALNGTGGTDHGTGAAAMLLGGAVKGGRVLADWPGLRQRDLFEGRDLRPTLALESLIAGAVAGHFAIDPGPAASTLYPTVEGVRPVRDLLRA